MASARLRTRAAALCGLVAAMLALSIPLVAACGEPAYSHVSQYISELGAAGAAHAGLVAAAGFAPLGALVLAFVALAASAWPRTRAAHAGALGIAATGTAYLASAVFPCDAGCPATGSASQAIHNAFGLAEYTGAIAGLALLGTAFRRDPVWRGLAPLTLAAAGLVALAFGAMLAPGLASQRGLFQRVAESAIFGWIALTSLRLLRHGARSEGTAAVVVAVCRSATHSMAKPVMATIRLVTGHGVEGDAHAGATVKHRSRVARDPQQPNLRQVHLIHAELHDALRTQGFDVAPGRMGENVTTRGLDLLALPRGTRLRLGARATIELTGLRNPCAQLDDIQPGLMAATLERDAAGRLVRKAGVMAIVVADGEVRPGDAIAVERPPPPHRPLEPV